MSILLCTMHVILYDCDKSGWIWNLNLKSEFQYAKISAADYVKCFLCTIVHISIFTYLTYLASIVNTENRLTIVWFSFKLNLPYIYKHIDSTNTNINDCPWQSGKDTSVPWPVKKHDNPILMEKVDSDGASVHWTCLKSVQHWKEMRWWLKM